MSKFKIEPLGGRVVIKQQENTETTYGNLVLSDLGKDKALQGEVIAVGPGSYEFGQFVVPKIVVGDNVLFPAFGGFKIDVKGEEYIVVESKDLHARLSKEEENDSNNQEGV